MAARPGPDVLAACNRGHGFPVPPPVARREWTPLLTEADHLLSQLVTTVGLDPLAEAVPPGPDAAAGYGLDAPTRPVPARTTT